MRVVWAWAVKGGDRVAWGARGVQGTGAIIVQAPRPVPLAAPALRPTSAHTIRHLADAPRPAPVLSLGSACRSWWPAPNRPSGDHGRLLFCWWPAGTRSAARQRGPPHASPRTRPIPAPVATRAALHCPDPACAWRCGAFQPCPADSNAAPARRTRRAAGWGRGTACVRAGRPRHAPQSHRPTRSARCGPGTAAVATALRRRGRAVAELGLGDPGGGAGLRRRRPRTAGSKPAADRGNRLEAG